MSKSIWTALVASLQFLQPETKTKKEQRCQEVVGVDSRQSRGPYMVYGLGKKSKLVKVRGHTVYDVTVRFFSKSDNNLSPRLLMCCEIPNTTMKDFNNTVVLIYIVWEHLIC